MNNFKLVEHTTKKVYLIHVEKHVVGVIDVNCNVIHKPQSFETYKTLLVFSSNDNRFNAMRNLQITNPELFL